MIYLLQEDSKIYKGATFLERFFDEQLKKLLPDYLMRKVNEPKDNETTEVKRLRLEAQKSSEIIDVGDDDIM